jgi:hypothetical protein
MNLKDVGRKAVSWIHLAKERFHCHADVNMSFTKKRGGELISQLSENQILLLVKRFKWVDSIRAPFINLSTKNAVA